MKVTSKTLRKSTLRTPLETEDGVMGKDSDEEKTKEVYTSR